MGDKNKSNKQSERHQQREQNISNNSNNNNNDSNTFARIKQVLPERLRTSLSKEQFNGLKKQRRRKIIAMFEDYERLKTTKNRRESELVFDLVVKKIEQYFYDGIENVSKAENGDDDDDGDDNDDEKKKKSGRRKDRDEPTTTATKRPRVVKPSRFDTFENTDCDYDNKDAPPPQKLKPSAIEVKQRAAMMIPPPPPPPDQQNQFAYPTQFQQQQQQQMMMMMTMYPPLQQQQQFQMFNGGGFQHNMFSGYPIGMNGYQMPPPIFVHQMPPASVIAGTQSYALPLPPPPAASTPAVGLRFGTTGGNSNTHHKQQHQIHASLENRLTPGDKTAKKTKKERQGGIVIEEEEEDVTKNRHKRVERFSNNNNNNNNNNEYYGEEIERPKSVTRVDSPRGEVTMAELKTGNKRAVGTNQSLTKTYMRLTSDPKASDIRPPAVLKKALQLVEEKWKSKEWTYDQLKEQLKSIRQDLTVQHAKGPLAVAAYETHARVALEHDDLAEYNQCQTVLKTLHERYIHDAQFEDARAEFAAYRLLYALIADETAKNGRQLFTEMIDLTEECVKHDFVKHALEAIVSVKASSFVKFFKLRKTAPNLNWILMQKHANRMRHHGLLALCASHRPTIPVSFVTNTLGFENDDECLEYLKSDDVNASFSEINNVIDCRITQSVLL